jgi:hypothetical protein
MARKLTLHVLPLVLGPEQEAKHLFKLFFVSFCVDLVFILSLHHLCAFINGLISDIVLVMRFTSSAPES